MTRPRVRPQPDWPPLFEVPGPSPAPGVTASAEGRLELPADVPAGEWIRAVAALIVAATGAAGVATADDVRSRVSAPPVANWWGAAWSLAARERGISRTGGYRRSSTPTRRHGAVAIWRPGR